jgi:hypothetical protein
MSNKNKVNKTTYLVLCLTALAVSCLVCACFMPIGNETGGHASFSITINGDSGRSVEFLSWEPEIKVADLVHNITLTNGPGPNIEQKDIKTGQTVQFKVTPGNWDITVKAYLGTELKAEGFTNVNLKPGNNGVVPVTMGPPVSTSTTFPITMMNDGNGTAIAEPESAVAGVTVNIQANPKDGFMFDEWEIVSGGVTLSGMKENPASFTMPQGPVTIRAHFEVVPPGTPVLSLSPVTFNPVTLGYDQPLAHIVTIHNSGTETATVSGITLGGTNADSFTLDGHLTPAIAVFESAVFTVRPVAGLGAGTYSAKIIASYSGGVVTNLTAETDISFTVNAHVTAVPPAISGHPQNAVYTQNANAVPLTVTALSTDGGELFYQWYRNETASTTSGTLVGSGSDKSSYTPDTASIGVFYYYCVVINTIPDNHDGGIKSASMTSSAAMVTVNNLVNAATPSITVQPAATTSVTIGGTVTLTVSATKTDNGVLTYQWYSHSTASNSNGSIIDGAKSYNYTTPNTLAIGNHYYYCVVTNTIAENGDGGNKIAPKASDVATVIIHLPVVSISAIPGVIPPAIGGTPVTAIDSAQYRGNVTWSPPDSSFNAGTTYTAYINLTAKEGFTLQGIAANFFTVEGAASVSYSANTEIVTVVFPATAFTSIVQLDTWLKGQPGNAPPIDPYNVKLNVASLGGDAYTSGSLGHVLIKNNGKYINLDLSDSTFTVIDDLAFFDYYFDWDTGDGERENCETLVSVTLPNTVNSIGEQAFYGCIGLANITIPNSVTSIGNAAFGECTGLTSITIPFVGNILNGTSDTSFGYIFSASIYVNQDSFIPPSLKTVIITGGNSIPDYAFYCVNITSITIPDSVTRIGDYAFYECIGLTGITIPNNVTEIGSGAFSSCTGLISMTIPNSVTSIGDDAFYGCTSLTSVTIGNSVTEIGYNAFFGTGLTSITIPNNVTDIDDTAFKRCTSLTAINVNSSNATYSSQNGVLYNKAGTEIFKFPEGKQGAYTIPDNVTSIGEAFNDCTGLTGVTIGNSVSDINTATFNNCTSLTAINVNSGNITYSSQDGVLYNKAGTAIIRYPQGKPGVFVIPDDVTNIGLAFNACKGLTDITIGSGITEIGNSAFSGCTGLSVLIIPDTVLSIGNGAFFGCTGLTSVIIGNGVKTIGSQAFHSCFNLETVTIGTGVISFGRNAFYNGYYNTGSSSILQVTFKGTIPSSGWENTLTSLYMVFNYGLRDEFYRYNQTNGMPGVYTRENANTSIWTSSALPTP